MDFQELYVEKFRPPTLSDIILAPDVREFFESIAKQEVKSIPHLLFYGPPGGGKTSLAHIIVKDILKCEYLYINASDENGIDTVRGKITTFIETKSFDGGIKVVILDEVDGMSASGGSGSSAQKALRNMMEEYAPYARFILTCNYQQKVMEPIWSRCQPFYIIPPLKEFTARCLNILKLEKITVSSEYSVKLMELIQDCYPDLRRCLNEIQKFSVTNSFKVGINNSKDIGDIAKIVWLALLKKKDLCNIRKYTIENESKFKSDYDVLMKNVFELVYVHDIEQSLKQNILIIIAEAMRDNVIVLDKEINFFAMCIKISNKI